MNKSFAAFQAKAENTNNEHLMESIQGGSLKDCHGFTGGLGKWWRGENEDITWRVGQ